MPRIELRSDCHGYAQRQRIAVSAVPVSVSVLASALSLEQQATQLNFGVEYIRALFPDRRSAGSGVQSCLNVADFNVPRL